MRKILPVLLLMPLLSACGAEGILGSAVLTNVAMGGATVASYSVLGQSPIDYAISKYRGQNCDIRNPKKYEGLYCVNGVYELAPERTVYCYRSLGDVDCSDSRDPYSNHNQPIVRQQPFTDGYMANNSMPASSSAAPVPAPVMLEPAGTTPVARPSTPPSPAAPAQPTPEDMAIKGS